MKSLVFILIVWGCAISAQAQNPGQSAAKRDTTSQGGWARRIIENGDTLYEASLRLVKITGPRNYAPGERDKLKRYRRYALKVYPYAMQAIQLYDEMEEETEDMNRRQKRRYTRKMKHEFKSEFEDELKKLYKTEGLILIKMIERQTGESCYDIIRDTRGQVTATYWNQMGKIWGYDLKEGYRLGADPILDEVLLDFDFGDAIWKY